MIRALFDLLYPMLTIKNLNVVVDAKKVIKGVFLRIKPGEIHAIMGPNGSGKSSLANAIIGHPKYRITSGDILWKNKSILLLAPEKRARLGIFLGFQYPQAIPGVTVSSFLNSAINSLRKSRNLKPLNPIEFRFSLNTKLSAMSLSKKFADRHLNDAFSGGEKKKMEILQMALLEPTMAILDEPDSGLDIDSLKTIAKEINNFSSSRRGILIITHYKRILEYVKPDRIHVMIHGKIVESGGKGLSRKLDKKGYKWLTHKKSQ